MFSLRHLHAYWHDKFGVVGTNQFDAREEVTSVAFVSPLSQQNGGGDDVAAPHSTPMSAGRYKSVPNNTISRVCFLYCCFFFFLTCSKSCNSSCKVINL